MQVNQKNWSCPKKQKARWETIISQYQKHFSTSLPDSSQYWTMCGQCGNENGEPLDGCEPSQLIVDGLIIPEQFYGVEINPEIHNLNVKAFPHLKWINSDFYSAMVTAKSKNNFNPAIVNADLPQTVNGGGVYISKLLSFLTNTPSDILFIANFILRMKHYTTKDGDYVMKTLNEHPQFRYAMTEGKWQRVDKFYEYTGTGNTGSRTYMGSFIFIKK